MGPSVHVVGAGLAGLTAAVRLTESGARVSLYEAAPYAGGRARSFYDATLDCVVDNGTHLLLSGNDRVDAYLGTIGSADQLGGPERARLDFLDMRSLNRWSLAPNAGPIPWWIFQPAKRVPDSAWWEYLAMVRLAGAPENAVVADYLPPGTILFERLWGPLCVSVMNTRAEDASARLLWPVIRETLGRGEAACRPRLAKNGLSAAFVDPALDWLKARGVDCAFSQRLEGFEINGGKVSALAFADHKVSMRENDLVILAAPAHSSDQLLPGRAFPNAFRPIVNVHYRLPEAAGVTDNGGAPLGLIHGPSDWLFVRGPLVSLTISDATAMVSEEPRALAERLWPEVARALTLKRLLKGSPPKTAPPFRVIKERRATIAQTPEQVARRPGSRTDLANLFLAGDWTDTGLPATIEGAIRSGERAAALAGARLAAGTETGAWS